MLHAYLKTAWRNVIGQKWFSCINVFGLAAGIAASIMLFLFIKHEVSFDKFHDGGERIYRVITSFGRDASDVLPRTMPGAAERVKEQMPEVEQSVRLRPERYDVQIGGQSFASQRVLMTDPSFADFFNFKVIAGDLRQTLSDPATVAVTREFARRLFGDEDPINQVFEIEHNELDMEMRRLTSSMVPVRVGAVMEDIPQNTHLRFSVLRSYDSYDPDFRNTFSNDVFVFFKAREVLSEEKKGEIVNMIRDYTVSRFGEQYRDILNYSLQSLHDIHFGPSYGYDMGVRGDLRLIYVFGAVAFFILCIAIINFINLVTARSEKRAVEAAIRKVAGAARPQIVIQFLGEAMLTCFMALILAFLLTEVFMGPFSNLLGRDLSLLQGLSLLQLAGLILLAPVIGLLAGLYPAIAFSRYQPVEILRGKARGGNKNPLLRIVLVVVQFSISVILMVAILVFNRQIHYMKHADLGFSADNVLVISGLTDRLVSGYEPLKAELLMHPGISSVASSQAYPGAGGSGMSLRKADESEEANISIHEFRVGRDFKETYGIRMVQGRWFDFDLQTDLDNFVVNQSTVNAMGLHDPVGQEVIMWRRQGRIIGVVNDFHVSSLKNEIGPLVMTAYAPAFYHISVRLSGQQNEQAIQHIENTLNAFDPNYAFQQWYLDSYFKSLYRQEENHNKILNYASLLAVIIAMLGILGLSSYIITARTREIGIRKVMGASVVQIISVLFSDIIRWVLLANIIAWPVAWYVMTNWLQGFPYRIEMSFGYLLIAGLASVLVVVFTISGQTLMAARKNPVHALYAE